MSKAQGELARIEDQLRRASEGDAWHGPALRELLADLTPEQAAARPIAGAHTIWELVLHIVAWQEIARRRLQGEVVHVTPAEDWPPPEGADARAWSAALDSLERSTRRIREAIVALPEARLGDLPPGTQTTIYGLLHGVIQHDLYHAGQIAILKKR